MSGGRAMKEWIVCADSPTRAMERWKSGEVVRCADCEHCAFLDGIGLVCRRLPFRFRTGPRMFCSWGEEGKTE